MPKLGTVENPHRIYGWPSISLVPLYPRNHGWRGTTVYTIENETALKRTQAVQTHVVQRSTVEQQFMTKF